MSDRSSENLAALFQAVGEALRRERERLNQADPYNGDHGDHMVEIFQVAVSTAQSIPDAELAEVMDLVGQSLATLQDNGSAQVYARGLKAMGRSYLESGVRLGDLIATVQGTLGGAQLGSERSSGKSGDVLKATLTGLAGWTQAESGESRSAKPLDMGSMFEYGLAYLAAKGRGGSRVAVLADAAASVTPLREVPHRYESGKIAIQAFLESMAAG